MSVSGKKLQDIYDSGSESLQSLEEDVRKRLKTASLDQTNRRRDGKDDTISDLDVRSKELEQSLHSFLGESVERLHSALEEEVKKTEEHLNSVKNEMTQLSEKLKTSIGTLRRGYEDNITHIHDSLTDQYISSVEYATSELEKQEFHSTKHLRAHGTFVINSLQQKLDHCLWESRGEEKQYNSSLFKAFMQKANSIDTHFSTLMQKLNTDFAGLFQQLETQGQQTEFELNQESMELIQSVDKQAAELEQELLEFFKDAQDKHGRNLDTTLNNLATDLGGVHDQITGKLTDHTKDLSNSLVTASGEARQNLTEKCAQLRRNIDGAMANFGNRMEEKLKTTNTMRDALETEKHEIFESIHKDLGDIWDTFEKRMTTLMSESLSRVNSIASEAEKEILQAHNNCQSKVRTDGTTLSDGIEDSVSKFLALLEEHRVAALEEMSKSAGNPSPASKTDASKPRRRRTRDESPEAEG